MPDYRFRPVTQADLPMLSEWLRDPQIARWWPGPDRQIALLREDLGHEVIRQVIALQNDTPLGYAQTYPAFHWPAPQFAGLPQDSIAIDVFGSPQGRGKGGAWLRVLGDLLLRDASMLVIDPAPENLRAIRAYEKAGFSGDLTRTDSAGQTVRVMTRRR
ncbi:GNAT family N-acetyltransferase [Paracoccus salsus]|uniref:GNAT family N-acetyltransferase n=1 Tax=Paracoccus salsus TaxID=2911061 RepID=UPI001F433D29|nr:GNAT family N-acetyltransferase [Paracoccus salsus]MCF3973645.1 acetyltransferase [Paracoccus salsus]